MADLLSTSWMGANLTKEGLDKMLKEYGVKHSRHEAESVTPEEANKEWHRLANFLGRMR